MNRKERREMERKYGKSFSMQQYRDDARREGEKFGAKSVLDVILYMTAYTLNYKLGFGRKRLLRIMQQIIENIDCYRTGQLDSNDYQEIIRMMNDLGFKVEDHI